MATKRTSKSKLTTAKPINLSKVEKAAIKASRYGILYPPTEKIPTLIVDHFPMLGQLTALRFLEWIQANPEGVMSLPTGKTPEYFIKWVQNYLGNWNKKEVRKDLDQWGLDTKRKPDMRGLHFVQIDEFYPISAAQTNSFTFYVKRFYLKGFGLDPRKALLIDADRIGLTRSQTLNDIWPDKQVDLTLRYRVARCPLEQRQKDTLERLDQWCMTYEDQIRDLGGIGFFLGGIGPDGHIGFNISGSDHFSTTRLCPINYPTQAAAAADLGGIEIARKCLVITIGLKTITANPDCTAIISAAGQAKAGVVARAIQSPVDVSVPASALQKLPNARFYITTGAADQLTERCLSRLNQQAKWDDECQEKILLNIADHKAKPLLQLTSRDLQSDPFGKTLLTKTDGTLKQTTQQVYRSVVSKIERGMQVLESKRFLHTEPHHDDVMLGYFAQVVRHFRRASNQHYFMTATSGFTSVTNQFMLEQVRTLQQFLMTPEFDNLTGEQYFRAENLTARDRDVWQYLDGIAATSPDMKAQGCARRFLRNVYTVYGDKDRVKVAKRLEQLADYFTSVYPGKHDTKDIQRLKGMCREWEVECLWGYYGWGCSNVQHLRLGFYTGDIFTRQPTLACDVMPIVKQLEAIRPDIITVAFDPEASGPDTHYKVLQVFAEALRFYQEKTGHWDIQIWGYRNVWYRFDPSEADIIVPVSLNMLSVMEEAFNNSFLSQRNASFPSYEHEGPFCELAQKIQVEQYAKIKRCLGRDWFHNHTSPLIRATRGFVFLKEMNPDEFYESCRRLRHSIEDVS
ncbi:MAG: glucosamine-6-phosphate deaminase [Phycisphaerae bacterium]|nr:glucosamine-6-phosphate deaminase [Phycisphaerae bacterium]